MCLSCCIIFAYNARVPMHLSEIIKSRVELLPEVISYSLPSNGYNDCITQADEVSLGFKLSTWTQDETLVALLGHV